MLLAGMNLFYKGCQKLGDRKGAFYLRTDIESIKCHMKLIGKYRLSNNSEFYQVSLLVLKFRL
jgi:hypothetical protein